MHIDGRVDLLMIRFWTDLWKSRTLVRQLVLTKVRASTARMLLGWVWWILDPILMMLVYWGIVFGIRGDMPTGQDPFPMFLLSTLIVWKHLASTVGRATGIYGSQSNVILSIPFCISSIPLAETISGCIPFVCGLLTYLSVSIVVSTPLDSGSWWCCIQIVPLLAIQLALLFGLALTFSIIGTLMRDIGGLVQHCLHAVYFLSPGLYSLTTLQERVGDDFFGWYIALNPAAYLMDSYRKIMFHGQWVETNVWLVMFIQSMVIMSMGIVIHQAGKVRVVRAL